MERTEHEQLLESPSVQTTGPTTPGAPVLPRTLLKTIPLCSTLSVGHLDVVTKDAGTSEYCGAHLIIERVVKVTGLYKLGISSLLQRVMLS